MNIGKSALILAIILVTAITGYWLYSEYFFNPSLKNHELISENAIFIFESQEADVSWNQLVSHPLWEKVNNLPAFQKIAENLSTLDSLTDYRGQISSLLNGKTLTISYHPTGAENFDLLYILQLDQTSLENLLFSLESRLPSGIQLQSRVYSETEITEVIKGTDTRLLSFAHLGGLLAFSESSFLIEEAIRKFRTPSESPDTLLYMQKVASNSLGKIHISGQGLANLIKGTAKNREADQIKALENLEVQASYQVYLDENQIRLEGDLSLAEQISFTPSLKANFSEIQKGISAKAISISQYNLEGLPDILSLENRGFTPKSTLQAEVQRNLIDRGFLDGLGGELYLQELEPSTDGGPNLVLVARILIDNSPMEILGDFLKQESSTFSNFYDTDEVFYVPQEELPAYLFSGKFLGFPQTFVVRRGDLLFFASSQSAIIRLLDDLNRGYSWDSDALPSELKSVLIPNVGFSQTYRLGAIWNKWTTQANSSWSSYLQRYRPIFTSFPYLTLRVNQIGTDTKSSILLAFNDLPAEEINTKTSVSLQSENSIDFESRLIWGPKSIKNYQDGTEDLMVQDENYVLHLINSAGMNVYRYPLSGPIISEAFQIDYYKNDKLQLLIATADRVYGIDRLGNSLTGYPFDLGKKLSHLNLIDYDSNLDYRLFLATLQGDLILLDKTGEQLDGWNPNSISESSVQSPRHFRVPGSGDFMGTLTASGNLHLFNRRGETQAGSPYNLSGEFDSELFFGRLLSSNSFGLTGVSTDGQVIEINFRGEVINRNQLLKEDRDSRFALVPDQTLNQFLIVSKTFNQLKIYNRRLEEQISIRVSEGSLSYQYFDFGSDRQIFVVEDPEQNFAYLYDLNGNLLTNLPLDSSGPIQISFDQRNNQYSIHTVVGRQLITYLLAA